MNVLRAFGRREAFQALGTPTDPPRWCVAGYVAPPCLCETNGPETPGCTPAPYCDDPGAEAPCRPSRKETAVEFLRTVLPVASTGALVGAGIGYGVRRDGRGALIGAGVGAVGLPAAIMLLAVIALRPRVPGQP